ncbi:uncharacterized protein LOC144640334 [Oculina patagonica]
MANNDSSRRPRTRNVKRTFVFLRDNDDLRVPGNQKLKTLQDSGRVKVIAFANNATSEHVGESLKNSFPDILQNVDLARLYYYKTVRTTKVLEPRGSCKDICGDTLKLTFQSSGKVYLRLKQQGATTNRKDNSSNRSVQDISSG